MAEPAAAGTVPGAPAASAPPRPGPVYLTVLVIATCGLVYELVAGTLASYLLGDSVTQFSLVIGLYLSALGLGAYLSKFVVKGVARRFVEAEIAVAFVGGLSAPALSLAFVSPRWFSPVFYGTVVVIGTLVGLEIPLLLRLLRRSVAFKDLVAQVLAFDYLGSLAASLLFPIVLLPTLGLMRTSILFGLLNAGAAFFTLHLFRAEIGARGLLVAKAAVVTLLLVAAFAGADRIAEGAEEQQYADEVVFARTSRYQRIVVTRSRSGFQLFLNGHLQFASADEYRYHEALVHPALAACPSAKRVAVLGGGDGLAVREVLRHPGVESVTLVDLDPAMTRLASEQPFLAELNGRSLSSPRVTVVNEDAMVWLARGDDLFDVVVADFPDPHSYSVGKLYTTHFYRLLGNRLAEKGVFCVQSTSPLFGRGSFWIIARTIAAAGFATRPYHAAVPSFGEWGFVLAGRGRPEPAGPLPSGLRFLTAELLPTLFVFPPDMAAPPSVPVNRLNDQVLVRTYEREWRRFE